jgi:flagellar biosynthesis/type III secretory pathway protein FliH
MFLRHIQFTSHLTGIQTDAAMVQDKNTSGKHNEHPPNETEEQELAALTRQTKTVLESVQRSLDSIAAQQRVADSELARGTVELAIVIAEHVVRRAIRAEDYGVEEIVSQAVARMAGQDAVTIYLNPTDIQRLEQLQASSDQYEFHDWNIQADKSLNRGDCYADAGDVGILTTLEQHLTGLRQWLLEGLDDGLPTTDDTRRQGDRSPDPIV